MKNIRTKFWKRLAPFVTELPYRVAIARHRRNLPQLSEFEQRIVAACQQEGVCTLSLQELNLNSSEALLTATQQQLAVMKQVRPANQSEEVPVYPQIFTVTDLPEFKSWGSEAMLSRIAEHYIGLPIAFQGVHLRRDFANFKPVTTEFWHLDLEDRKMLKAVIYLTDVDEEQGPFEYIPKSQISPLLALRIRLQTQFKLLLGRLTKANDVIGLSDRELEKLVPRSRWRSCLGKAGTVVFFDPAAVFHHGKSRRVDRSTLFFIYTAANPLRPDCCTQYRDRTFARPASAALLKDYLQPKGT